RIATWRFEIRRAGAAAPWQITDQEQVTSVEGLYHLSLNPTKQFDAHNLTIAAEDFELTVADGNVFAADTDQGVTALVLLGAGQMHFHPKPETEKGQVRIFCGKEALVTRFDAAFIRINPADLERWLGSHQLAGQPVDARAFRRAEAVFREELPNSFGLDLADLSRESWSLVPGYGDF